MAHNIQWRNPSTTGSASDGLNSGVKTYSDDPHACHLPAGYSATGCSSASGTCPLRTIGKMIAPTGSNSAYAPTQNNPQIWNDVFSAMRVFGVSFIPYPSTYDSLFISNNMLLGNAKLVKHTDGAEYVKFKDDESYGAFSLWMIPSSGIVGNGGGLPASMSDSDVWEPGIRIYNSDLLDAFDIKFTVNATGIANGVVYAGASFDSVNINTLLRNSQGFGVDSDAATRLKPISDFADLDAIVAWYNGRVETNGTWSASLTSLDGTIVASSITPTLGFQFCFGSFTDLFESLGVTATVELTELAGTKTMTLRYEGHAGGGVSTTVYTLTDAAVDTLAELESAIEGLGELWVVQVEADNSSLSNNLGATVQTNIIGPGTNKLIYVQNGGSVLRTVVSPTDQIVITDTSSLALGRLLIAGDDIDLSTGLVAIEGGAAPSDKVLFGPSASEINVTVARQVSQWIDPGTPPVWKTATPNVGAASVAAQYANTCRYWRHTGLNVRYTGLATDDWKVYEFDHTDIAGTYRNTFGCTVVNSANQVPGSAQDTLANYNLGADGNATFADWVTTGYIALGRSTMVPVLGCNGGPPDDRCPFYESQAPAYNLETFFSKLMYGEWWTYKQDTFGIARFSIDWRSPYSIAALAGTFPDNNSALNTRVNITHVSGGIGCNFYADFAEDGTYFKAFHVSNEDQDTTNVGQCYKILGANRKIPRYNASAMSSVNVGTAIISDWDTIFDGNFLAIQSYYERSLT